MAFRCRADNVYPPDSRGDNDGASEVKRIRGTPRAPHSLQCQAASRSRQLCEIRARCGAQLQQALWPGAVVQPLQSRTCGTETTSFDSPCVFLQFLNNCLNHFYV